MITSVKRKGWNQVEENHLCGYKDFINLHTNAGEDSIKITFLKDINLSLRVTND